LRQRNKSIIASAPSNTSVDHLAKKLVDSGFKIVRFGNSPKIENVIWKYTVEGILSKEKYQKEIKKLRIQAENCRKKAQKFKRKFGEPERKERTATYAELKSIRKEIAKTIRYFIEKEINQADIVLGTPISLQNEWTKHIEYDVTII